MSTHGDPEAFERTATMAPDLAALRAACGTERCRLLARKEEPADQARSRLMSLDDFASLEADHAHRVLRPMTLACTATTADAIAPPLDALGNRFDVGLRRAEDQANELLDGLLAPPPDPSDPPAAPVNRMDLHLRNRGLTTVAQVDALVAKIRERLGAQGEAGRRGRIV